MENNMDENFEYFLEKDFSGYEGKWVAIHNRKIVASDKSLKKVLKAGKRGNREPLFAKIPEKNIIRI